MEPQPRDALLRILEPLAERAWRGLADDVPGAFLVPSDALAPGHDAESMRAVLAALYAHARRWAPGLDVPWFVPPVRLGDQSPAATPSTAGSFVVSEGYATIAVAERFVGYDAAVRLILAHEACHHIALQSGIDRGGEDMHIEVTTDLLMFVCGFGALVLRGFRHARSYAGYEAHQHLGYLSSADYHAVHAWVMARRAGRGLAGAPEFGGAAAQSSDADAAIDAGAASVVQRAARGAWDEVLAEARAWTTEDAVPLDDVALAAALALEAARPEVAAELLTTAWAPEAVIDAIEALQDGDGERAFVTLQRFAESPMSDVSGAMLVVDDGESAPGGARLFAALAARCSEQLRRGDWHDRVLAAQTALLVGRSREDWLQRRMEVSRAHGLPLGATGLTAVDAALAAVHLRRRGGADDAPFVRWLAGSGCALVDAAPELLPEAARLAERVLAASPRSQSALDTWAAWALSEGRSDEVRARYAAYVAAAKSEATRKGRARAEGYVREAFGWARERLAARARHAILDEVSQVDALEELGAFELTTGALTVTDPCNASYGQFNVYHPRARPGTWVGHVALRRRDLAAGEGPLMCAAVLFAHHRDAPCSLTDDVWEDHGAMIGVDSGMVGIFDAGSVRDERAVAGEEVPVFTGTNRWFDLCYARTTSARRAGVLPLGCVSESGCGDGVYPCLLAFDEARRVAAVCVDFLVVERAGQTDDDDPPDAGDGGARSE